MATGLLAGPPAERDLFRGQAAIACPTGGAPRP